MDGEILTDNKYVVEMGGISYQLSKAQYKAYLRKKDMPIDRLKTWLTTYTEENKHLKVEL